MSTGNDLVNIARLHVGEKYVFGALVPKNYKDYTGPWDCAEFASWLVYQLTGTLYGCANNAGDPAGADSYSGFWGRDADKLGKKISLDAAAKYPGAVIIRMAAHGITGHVVISQGNGKTIEAASTKLGVITSTLDNRRWDFGVLVPGITYPTNVQPIPPIKKPGIIYRWTAQMMHGDKIKEIQKALDVKQDGFYGPKTFNAVRFFQRNSNLVPDGEVGQLTAEKLGITL